MADITDKITKLLAKAERASTEEEANVYNDKAEALIIKHGIEEAELQAARAGKDDDPDPMTYKMVNITGTYNRAELQLAHSIATGLQTVRTMERIKGSSECILYVFGHKSDIAAFEQLWRSLKRQAYRDAVAWSKSDPGFATLKAHAKVREKVTFIDGFGTRVWDRLATIRKSVQAEVGTGSELVLQSKSKRATNYAESQFTVGTSRRRMSDTGSQNARQAGHVAGGKAELQGMIK